MTATVPTAAPFGSWRSPITIDALLAGGVGLSEVRIGSAGVFWLESRPEEGGRSVLVRRSDDGSVSDVTPAGFSVRSRVHEYGGGSYVVAGFTVYFSNDEDQRLYRQQLGGSPEPITPEPRRRHALRYADFCVLPSGLLICVRESHPAGGEAVNELVAVATDGSKRPRVLVTGPDFFAHPRVSPDGRHLAWFQWNHPNMPWDGTRLCMAEIAAHGRLHHVERIAGGRDESVVQPEWSPDGTLHFLSDRTGWWNLYAWRDGAAVALFPAERDFAGPWWMLAQSFYGFLPNGRIVCAPRKVGRDASLVLVDPQTAGCWALPGPHTFIDGLSVHEGKIAFAGASVDEPVHVVLRQPPAMTPEVIRRSVADHPGPDCVARPRHITYRTVGGVAHGFFYPPTNPAFTGPEGELPPVLVMVHGGPTGAVGSWYVPALQFWTSRGFAVVDVNYRGSTGYGRRYRDALKGRCGIAEAEDCIRAVRYLAKKGLVDGKRALIRGGSAGGAIVLTAVTFHDTFAAGASYYGIGDVELLVADTHKFESRYVDSLIGPYPEAKAKYIERSPVHFADQITCPVLLLQGSEDKVVPPNQAETFAAALEARGTPHAHLVFEGEGHGFRRADSMRRALEAELSFYGQVLGFEPADDLPPLAIKNLPQATGP